MAINLSVSGYHWLREKTMRQRVDGSWSICPVLEEAHPKWYSTTVAHHLLSTLTNTVTSFEESEKQEKGLNMCWVKELILQVAINLD